MSRFAGDAITKRRKELIKVNIRAPTGKSVGSDEVAEIVTDVFTRRSAKKTVRNDLGGSHHLLMGHLSALFF
jgi:hypothetical protein